MFLLRNKGTITQRDIRKYFKSYAFQRIMTAVITVLLAFILVETGAAPVKYKLSENTISQYDINAPRDIENRVKTEENAKAAAAGVAPVMMEIVVASPEVYKGMDDFLILIDESRKSIMKKLDELGISKKDEGYKQRLEEEQNTATDKTYMTVNSLNVPLSMEQVRYLVAKASDEEVSAFAKTAREIITNAMKEDITEETLVSVINKVQNDFQTRDINQELKHVGSILARAILKPNRTIDTETTKRRQEEAYNRQVNVVKILKGERIISQGEVVTHDKFKILEELNLLETTRRFDFAFALGIFFLLLLLTLIVILYMYNFCREILQNRNDVIILCVIILLILTIARWVGIYSPVAVPIFIATISISILLDLKLSIVVNFVLTIAIALITKGNLNFVYMSIIGGSLSAFMVSGANQRSRLSMTGLILGVINALIIVCLGLINKSGLAEIGRDSLFVFLNGVISIIITIGLLPFWESAFNVITPLKLLELANPNQPLLKRLLVEAPGTYHHSLMVGNLAEVATEAIGGDALLARVGAYFHDVGKLARPNFFKENQMTENPHDRITPNLSTLIITSHTSDGVALAKKHKIPLAIRDIIAQHHGTTMVAYFYHKAKKGEKGDQVKPESFRYEGPRPASKEAAVVMLADSVEAAVRSMVDKTEGKIEGLVRKIIKDKLDDGQLDLCNLTLKDLDSIAKAFMRVFSGFFHERQQYPEIKVKDRENDNLSLDIMNEVEKMIEQKEQIEERQITNGNLN